jgi:hypothetical protein
MTSEDRVLAVLQEHRGAEQAITAPRICRRLHWSHGQEREIRRIITEHANLDWPGVLCAIPGVGYFFAEDLEEIRAYRQYLMELKKAAWMKLQRFDSAMTRSGFYLKETA